MEGAANYDLDTYVGLLQEDLPKEAADRRNCRIRVFERLIEKLNLSDVENFQPSTKCKYLEREGLCIGTTRNAFKKIYDGKNFDWKANGSLLFTTFQTTMFGFTGNITHEFENEKLARSKFVAQEKHVIDRYFKSISSNYRLWFPDDAFTGTNEGTKQAVDNFCNSANAIHSTLIDNYGAPVDGPVKQVVDYKDSVYKQNNCGGSVDCDISPSSEIFWNTKYKVNNGVFLKLGIANFDLHLIRETSTRKRDLSQYNCKLIVELTPT